MKSILKMKKLSKIMLSLTIIMCMSLMMMNLVFAEDEIDVTKTGLDLTKNTPTTETVYKAGEGTIVFKPAAGGSVCDLNFE